MKRRHATVVGAGLLALLATLTACSTSGGTTVPASHPASVGQVRASPPTPAPMAPSLAAAPHAAARPTVSPGLRRCHGERQRTVVVSLAVQHLWLCRRGRAVRSFPITSGRVGPNTHTPTGSFHIQGRNRNSVLTLASGRQYDVKYWIPFNAPDFGFHDSPWQHFPYGSSRYREHGSHGCVHLPLTAIRFLYNWAEIGTPVHITAS